MKINKKIVLTNSIYDLKILLHLDISVDFNDLRSFHLNIDSLCQF